MTMVRIYAIGLGWALMSLLCLASGVPAAEKTPLAPLTQSPPQDEITYDDPLGRSTPQGTVRGFLKAMQREDHERAVDYLDTRQTGKRAHQLALSLSRVLDQAMLPTAVALSANPEGSLQDSLPVHREIIGRVKTKGGEYKLLLDRIRKENNPPVWLFSAETLKLVPKMFEEVDIPGIEKQLPAVLVETRVAGYPIYRWLITILMLPVAFLGGWLLTALLAVMVRGRLRRRFDEPSMLKLERAKNPLRLLFAAVVVFSLSRGILSLIAQLFWNFVAATMAVVGLTWLAIHMIEAVAEIVERRRHEAANAVIRLSATLLKILAVVMGLMIVFHYFAGINLTAVVAGLGLGGIAVAFAAQKSIENFFGGVFLVWDKPIRLGDFCKAGEFRGTIENIGLRSTQMRTLNRTVVSIPNGQLSSVGIENFAMRDRFLFQHTLNLRYETTADQLRCLLIRLRELLYRHPRVDSATVRVRFVGFGSSSLDVEIFAYITETLYDPFLAVQEDLLLRIMDLVGECGSGFAFPSQTLYVSQDGALNENRGREASEAVRRWREQGELPFPAHTSDQISQIDGTLDYPPKGSVRDGEKGSNRSRH
jgi:MscS family membrane protein